MKEKQKESAGGGWSLIIIFLLVVILFLAMAASAVQDALSKPSLDDINRQRAKLASWAHVEGVLDQVNIVSVSYQRTRYPTGTDYWPEVKYHFSVGGKDYQGDCLRKKLPFQENPYFCSDPITGVQAAKDKLKAFLPSGTSEHESMRDKLKVRTYYPKSSVVVFYNPQNPLSSQLDGNWQPQSWLDYYGEEIGMFCFCICIALMMLASVIIAVSVSRKKENQPTNSK